MELGALSVKRAITASEFARVPPSRRASQRTVRAAQAARNVSRSQRTRRGGRRKPAWRRVSLTNSLTPSAPGRILFGADDSVAIVLAVQQQVEAA